MLKSVLISDEVFQWFERRRKAEGFKTPHAAMKHIITEWAQMPEECKPKKQGVDTSGWPVQEIHLICPNCAGKYSEVKHCGGGKLHSFEDIQREVIMQYVCDCQCPGVSSGVANSGLATAGLGTADKNNAK